MPKDVRKCLSIVFLSCSLLYPLSSPAQPAMKKTNWTMRTLSKQRNYDVSVKYPVFSGTSTFSRKLNSKLGALARNQYREALKKHSSDANRPQEPKGEFKANYKVEKISDAVASLSCDVLNYSPDAATSGSQAETFNFTPSPFAEFHISDLFKVGIPYKDVLKILAVKELFATTREADKSIALSDDDFEKFALHENELVLFFVQDAPNEVTNVTVSINQIYDLIDSKLARKLFPVRPKSKTDGEWLLNAANLQNSLAIIAIGTYTQMLAADPSNTNALRERGKWYQKLGRPEIGAKDIEEALRIDKR